MTPRHSDAQLQRRPLSFSSACLGGNQVGIHATLHIPYLQVDGAFGSSVTSISHYRRDGRRLILADLTEHYIDGPIDSGQQRAP